MLFLLFPQKLQFSKFSCLNRTVLDMKEIKTDTGYARAWTRLALEKKSLAKELHLLLDNKKILK